MWVCLCPKSDPILGRPSRCMINTYVARSNCSRIILLEPDLCPLPRRLSNKSRHSISGTPKVSVYRQALCFSGRRYRELGFVPAKFHRCRIALPEYRYVYRGRVEDITNIVRQRECARVAGPVVGGRYQRCIGRATGGKAKRESAIRRVDESCCKREVWR